MNISNNSNSEFDVVSFSSSLEDSSFQQGENDSFCEYDYDSDYQEEEQEREELRASDDEDAAIAESAMNQQVEIIFPVQHEEDLLIQTPPLFSGIQPQRRSSSVSVPRQQEQESGDVSFMASYSLVAVDAPSYASIISASGADLPMRNSSSIATTCSWSHIDSIDAELQSITSAMMNTIVTSKSVISAFELVSTADGSIRARCKACGFMNLKDEKFGLCRGCNAVLVNNPCLELDEALARTLQQKEAKDALVHRKKMASIETPPFVRAQALAAEVNSMVLCGRNVGTHSSTAGTSTLDGHDQEECVACHPINEMDLTFQASSFIERLEFFRSNGFRLALGYSFSLKTDVADIYRNGLPKRNCRLIVSTDPEAALRLMNGLSAVATITIEDKKVEGEKNKDDSNKQDEKEDETNKQDEKEGAPAAPPPMAEPLSPYNEDTFVGWIVAVVSSLDDSYLWSTVEHKNNEHDIFQKIEFLSKKHSNSCNCLPLACFDAKHRKDAHVAALFQGLSDVCFDFFHTDWSLITIDEEEDNDRNSERDQGGSANENVDSIPNSGTSATRNSSEHSRQVDRLDEGDSDALKMPMAENAAYGYCSSDDDDDDDTGDEDSESNASRQEQAHIPVYPRCRP